MEAAADVDEDGAGTFPEDAELEGGEQSSWGPRERAELWTSWIKDPAKFCAQAFTRPPREFQPALMRVVRDNPRTSVAACRYAGKTALAGYLSLWWMSTRPGALVVTTAPTMRQVEKVIWVEIATLWRNSILPRLWPTWEVQVKELKTHREDWRAIGFSSDSPDKIEGLHGGPVLAIYDEAKAVARDTRESMQGMLKDDHPWRELAISTPGPKRGWFFETFYGAESRFWQSFKIKGEDIARIAPKVAKERERLGAENPWFKRFWMAEFAGDETGELIPVALAEEAVDRALERPAGAVWESVLAVDPAGVGTNETCVTFRVGPCVVWQDAWEGWDEMATVGEIVKIYREVSEDGLWPVRLIVDRPGLGRPIISRLLELGLPVEEFNPGAASSDPEQWANLKTQVAYGLRDRFFAGEISIPSRLRSQPEGHKDNTLVGQLTSYTVVPTSRGADRLEKPEGDLSPDRADSLLIAFAADLMGGGVVSANIPGL